MATLAETHHMPTENLLQPEAIRRLTWEPPADLDEGTVEARLRELGAREWQIALTAGPLSVALTRLAAKEEPEG